MLGEYRGMLSPEDMQRFSRFASEVESYFDSLEPAVRWTPEERSRFGYAFMQTNLLPRRLVVIGLTDQIAQLNARQLDAGNRQVADLFSRFRLWLIALLVGTLLLGLLLAGGSIYRVLRLERLSEQRLQDAVDAQLASRELSARLLSVQESERRAISRELHDEVGQQVSALLLAIGNVVATLSAATVDQAKQQLQEIQRVAERTVALVRDMSLLLRPSMLDDLGLIPALEWQAREVSRTHGLRVSIHASDISEQLADEQKTCIYRVVQEALRNVTRHAKAKSAEVILEQIGGSLELRIHDDGQGFVPERQKGLGLLGIEERVLLLRGSVRLDSRPGAGTTLIVGMPILRDEAALSPA